MKDWRPIRESDREAYIAMATAFYNTNAVIKPIPASYIEATFAELMHADTYAQCYICELADGIVGYALLAKTFSQEAGGYVMWIEELYLKEGYRNRGLGRAFFESFLSSLPENVKRIRLEAERDNAGAVKLYESLGFEFLEYDQMVLGR